MESEKEGQLTKEARKDEEGMFEEYEGQLAIDAYQTNDAVVIKAPIAGVKSSDVEIAITDEVVTVKGKRKQEPSVSEADYFCQECYWGSFSRSYIIPVPVDSEKAQAGLKDGILTILIPKQEKSRTRVIKVTE
jgi:HSP20 family protein